MIFSIPVTNYPHPITKKDRDEIVRALTSDELPLVSKVNSGKDIYKSAMKTMKNKEAPTMSKKNAKMLLSLFADRTLAKAILDRML